MKCVSMTGVVRVVADNYQLTADDVRGQSHAARIVEARYIACMLAYELVDLTELAIGEYMGGRCQSSVSQIVCKARVRVARNPVLRCRVDILREMIVKASAQPAYGATDGVATAHVICSGLLDGSVPKRTRDALLELAIAALQHARATEIAADGAEQLKLGLVAPSAPLVRVAA